MTTTSDTTPDTALDTDRLMALWATPPADDAEALSEIRKLYTDPVVINGATFAAEDLLARIRALQGAYRDVGHELIERVEAPGRLVIAFRMRGVHVGPLDTPLGTVAATGRAFEMRVIDVLTLAGGRVSAITMVADELTQLRALGAITLA
jgi:hypothetical protein